MVKLGLIPIVLSLWIAAVSAHEGEDHGPAPAPAPSSSPAAATSAYSSTKAATDLKTLCSSLSYLPVCSINSMVCASMSSRYPAQCNPVALVHVGCSDPAAKSSAACSTITALCTSTPSDPACSANVTALPSAQVASAETYSICTEMPKMTACNICTGQPSASGVYQNCDPFNAFSQLCLDMPMMTQCPAWTDFCMANNITTYCGGSAPMPSMTGMQSMSGMPSMTGMSSPSSTSSPSATPKSGAMATKDLSLGVLSALAITSLYMILAH
ncbi:uncharacterized protein BJ171DRAFT_473252 [Polychytrium aggregatum]|uniref:uncharacterized protein n=1 Tax=Polychytrium aggregatum TaxID=110093 RepID=UPI0022FDED96|nr:uncharacterized protein BJ171DRAFT_473252 [Polychytrium aggregatum]KAI9206753.1 hypothetical protein BJ171DRAFT_473252 [Polychytrium aggregatum]